VEAGLDRLAAVGRCCVGLQSSWQASARDGKLKGRSLAGFGGLRGVGASCEGVGSSRGRVRDLYAGACCGQQRGGLARAGVGGALDGTGRFWTGLGRGGLGGEALDGEALDGEGIYWSCMDAYDSWFSRA